jgi:hypothetical protein
LNFAFIFIMILRLYFFHNFNFEPEFAISVPLITWNTISYLPKEKNCVNFKFWNNKYLFILQIICQNVSYDCFECNHANVIWLPIVCHIFPSSLIIFVFLFYHSSLTYMLFFKLLRKCLMTPFVLRLIFCQIWSKNILTLKIYNKFL